MNAKFEYCVLFQEKRAIICCLLHRLTVDELRTEDLYGRRKYTWGSATSKLPILCNGQVVEVTRNLYEALLYLRH